MKLLAMTLMVVLVAQCSAFAAPFAIPRSLATSEGGTSEITLGFLGAATETRQLQIAASELSAQGLLPGDLIIGVRPRLNGSGTANQSAPASTRTWDDLTVKLAQATHPISSMSMIFDENMTNPVTVMSGPFSVPALSVPGGSTPNSFGNLISFTAPYKYQGGDLVLYFTLLPASPVQAGLIPLDAATTSDAPASLYRGLGGPMYMRTTALYSAPISVLQFEVVPEPSPFFLCCIGAMGSLLTARNRGSFQLHAASLLSHSLPPETPQTVQQAP